MPDKTAAQLIVENQITELQTVNAAKLAYKVRLSAQSDALLEEIGELQSIIDANDITITELQSYIGE